MGARQSKRSVDITAPPSKEGKEAVVEGLQAVEEKLEKIEEGGDKPATNGSSHSEPEIKVIENSRPGNPTRM